MFCTWSIESAYHWNTYAQIMGSLMTDFLIAFPFREGLGMAAEDGSSLGTLQ